MLTRRDLQREKRTLTVTSEPGREILSQEGQLTAEPEADRLGAPDVTQQPKIPQDKPLVIEENPDPYRRRIGRVGRHKGGLLAWLYRSLQLQPRELTPEEIEKKSEQRKRRELEGLLKNESILAMRRIINCLDQLNLCYRYPKSQKDFVFQSGIQSVKFTTILMQPEALYFKVDVHRLPRGISLMQLAELDVLNNLSIACGHRVICKYNEVIGFWFVIERATGIMGIPNHVEFQGMMDLFPKTADELTIPLGMSVNSKRAYFSIKAMPHLLIAGATGSGKSNEVNVILGTLISRNNPNQLRLVMIDLKGGMELGFYEGIPHLWPVDGVTDTGIITEQELVQPLLNEIMEEAKRRMYKMEREGHKDISRYNAHRKGENRLPRILLVIDEWANVRLGDHGAQAEKVLANITAQGRAVGIHVILATQVPSRQVISLLIKTNLPGKMCFSVPSYTASEVVINTGDAQGLAPQGRFVFQCGSDTYQVQAPLMPDQIIRELVTSIKRHEDPNIKRRNHDVSIDELLEYALGPLEGSLNRRQLFEAFKQRGITRDEISQILMDLEDQKVVVIGENSYQVKAASGGAPRTLEIIK